MLIALTLGQPFLRLSRNWKISLQEQRFSCYCSVIRPPSKTARLVPLALNRVSWTWKHWSWSSPTSTSRRISSDGPHNLQMPFSSFRSNLACDPTQRSLPPSKSLARLVLLDNVHFTWKLFFASGSTLPSRMYATVQTMQAIVFDNMQQGISSAASQNSDESLHLEEPAKWQSIWVAWLEEQWRRPPAASLVNPHDVCCEILTHAGRNRDLACEICKCAPFWAPKSKVCTFHLLSDTGASFIGVCTMLWYPLK